MSKRKKSTILMDGIEYRVIQWTNLTETNYKYVPQNPQGIIGSGLHVPEKNKQEIHWDYYNGNKPFENKKEYVKEGFKMAPIAAINFKEHQVFLLPKDNQIIVLRGENNPMEFISYEYYKKNKVEYLQRYSVKLGTEENPQVLELKPR
jgi:hypothetical protein